MTKDSVKGKRVVDNLASSCNFFEYDYYRVADYEFKVIYPLVPEYQTSSYKKAELILYAKSNNMGTQDRAIES